PKVFMSYSWQDEEAVLAIDQWLRNHGIEVFIDRRDFIVGSDIYNEMSSKIRAADKVIIFHSGNSSNRPYTTLERRMAQEREASAQGGGMPKIIMIYLQLDDEPLPPEATHRLSIRAKGNTFEYVCAKLLDAIYERRTESLIVDVEQYKMKPPW